MTCNYAKCTNNAVVKRQRVTTEEIFKYCEGHDPLREDCYVNGVFQEVNE